IRRLATAAFEEKIFQNACPRPKIARKRGRSTGPASAKSKIDVEDRHREIVGAIAVLVVDVDHAEKLIAEIDLCGIVLARPHLDCDLRVERALEVGVEFLDFFGLHNSSP